MRPRRAAALAAASSLAVASALLAACAAAPPPVFPDHGDVAGAQAKWCAMLGRVDGAGDAWEPMAACKAGYPAASASYLRQMTKCYEERVASYAKKDLPDGRQIAAACADEIVFHMPAEGGAARAVWTARCERMQRCESVAPAECQGAIDRLDPTQRAMFTTTFNDEALHGIEACLATSACATDEDAARDACYAPAREKLLWFPL